MAVQPYTRGFAFALFEGAPSPVDWGVKVVKQGNTDAATIAAVEKLVALWHPELLLVMDYGKNPKGPSVRIQRMHEQIGFIAAKNGIPIRRYGRAQIQRCFSGVGATTRYQIAQAIASQIPAFGEQLPAPRKVWETEDPRMNMFDAIGLVMTHYSASPGKPSPQ